MSSKGKITLELSGLDVAKAEKLAARAKELAKIVPISSTEAFEKMVESIKKMPSEAELLKSLGRRMSDSIDELIVVSEAEIAFDLYFMGEGNDYNVEQGVHEEYSS